jgi:hypothetical protein
MTIRLSSGFSVVLVVLCSIGCGPPERAVVKGKVMIGDTPLSVGSVTFTAKDNSQASATIERDGTYELLDAPLGETKITVMVPQLPPGGLEMMRKMKNNPGAKESESVDPNDASKKISIMGDIPDTYVPVPPKYADINQSGLTYTVQRGEQTHDIQLTP